MRILHTSDWHLGRTLHGVDLLDHQARYLDHLVEAAQTEKVDAVLVSGDVYDRAVPPVPAVQLLESALRRLADRTHVVLTSGNHDSAVRLGFGSGLFTERVRVRCRLAEIGQAIRIPTRDGDLAGLVYGLPYLDPDVARYALADDEEPLGRSHEAVVAAAMRRVHVDLGRRRADEGHHVPAVVMAHAFVVGGTSSESERDIRVGGVDSVPAGLFTGQDARSAVDYAALGHLHGPQQVRAPRVGDDGAASGGPVLRYAGSPLAYSFSEQAQHKSTALVELGPDGASSVELLAAPVPRPLRDVTGTLEELQGRAFDADVDAWIRATVTDDVRPPELYAAVVKRFPHALVVQHRPARERLAAAAPAIDAGVDPLEIAAQFVYEVGGRHATTEEALVLRAAYEHAVALDRSP